MNDKQQALRDLMDKVDAGDGHATELPFWRVWVPEEEDGRLAYVAANAYNGSLDSALALHNAVLPGCRARLDIGRRFRAWIITEENAKFDAYSGNPARAWLIAILKALIAKGEA